MYVEASISLFPWSVVSGSVPEKGTNKVKYMQKYELLYIVPAKYTEEELKGFSEKVGAIVSQTGVHILETTVLGKRKLAYPIRHLKYGHYVLVDLEAEEDVIGNLNRTLRLTTELLRHLIIVKDPSLTKIPDFADSGEIVKAEREDSDRRDRRRAPRKPASAPAQKKDVNMADLDKKLDEILTEEVL